MPRKTAKSATPSRHLVGVAKTQKPSGESLMLTLAEAKKRLKAVSEQMNELAIAHTGTTAELARCTHQHAQLMADHDKLRAEHRLLEILHQDFVTVGRELVRIADDDVDLSSHGDPFGRAFDSLREIVKKAEPSFPVKS
ncbi:MAG TPA: hypothetical protein VFF73_14410 [Planctomycetota bacterium]|nr:hypothetical protein [Planctomycetota bacterium]